MRFGIQARRLAEEAARKKLQLLASQKAAARAYAGQLLDGLEDATLQEMLQAKEFLKPVTVSTSQAAGNRQHGPPSASFAIYLASYSLSPPSYMHLRDWGSGGKKDNVSAAVATVFFLGGPNIESVLVELWLCSLQLRTLSGLEYSKTQSIMYEGSSHLTLEAKPSIATDSGSNAL